MAPLLLNLNEVQLMMVCAAVNDSSVAHGGESDDDHDEVLLLTDSGAVTDGMAHQRTARSTHVSCGPLAEPSSRHHSSLTQQSACPW